ncbi:LacI family DNA-binding transcriptional regulator [Tsukamurella spumae]|uniref:LacI family transcriptional regulator n=1 Tax=Tsukamurella spumae TaxID=44753 RepID=A0A846X037_9ACTN|nr:LacI family DNA-binding transcriptional regulator [Tsukamurella spumae]NKY18604.1 LacI family transcriptional regulator [Tsukamurella spumae]
MIPKKQVAMKDVAQRLGISISTVSRALTGKPGVAPATRRRIVDGAAALGYVADSGARVVRNRAGRICVVVPRLDAWYYAAVADGAQEALRERGYTTVLRCVRTHAERLDFFRTVPEEDVDGLIAVSFPMDAQILDRVARMSAPVVAVSSRPPGVPSATIDDRLAATRAVGHLVRMGHRRIGLIRTSDPEGVLWDADVARDEGYRSAMAAQGIPVSDDLMVTAPWGIEGGAEAMERLLGVVPAPTAVFCFSDEVALGALRTLRRMGIAVPEQMSVIAVDDHPMAGLADLTTVAQPARRLGMEAARLVLARLDGGTAEDVVLDTRLVARHTTAVPP